VLSGIPQTIQSLVASANAEEARLNTLPTQILTNSQRQDYIGIDGNGQEARCFHYIQTFLNISGSLAAAYGGSVSTATVPGACTSELHPPGQVGGPQISYMTRADKMLQLAVQNSPSGPPPQTTIPTFAPSGYPDVDQRNQTRIDILTKRAQATDLPYVSSQIQQLQNTLQSI
jgi:hypothetical protein